MPFFICIFVQNEKAMINSVRDTVHDFLEKNNRGWLKPERFNNYAFLAQMEIFESYFYDYNRWLNAQTNRQAHSHYADIPANIRQKLDIFLKVNQSVTASSGSVYPMPADFYRLMDVYYNGDFVDPVSYRRYLMLNKSNLTAPSTTYPVYVSQENTSDEFQEITVYPVDITSGVTIDYVRMPATPKWTYTTVSGNPVFNQSAGDYQDFEIHPADEHRLVTKILGFAGLSIRESDVVQYAEMQEAQKKQNESRA